MRFFTVISLLLSGMAMAFPNSPAPVKTSEGVHWAFEIPQVSGLKGDRHPIDELLVTSGLIPVGEASREVLLRRMWHVTTGLLPTAEQRERWLSDSRKGEEWLRPASEEALSQNTFGERWARHWLDVARYADSKGAAITDGEEYPYAYTYRDWVIGAFNRDLPFDEFVHRQVAADLMEVPKSELAALGFLTVGRAYQGGQRHLVVADQIDVVTRGFMGLTVACARCHDHKSDPIPTADFYSLYGVFDSAVVPKKLPVIAEPEDSPGYRKFQAERLALAEKVHAHVKEVVPEYEARADPFDFNLGKANGKLNQKQREKFRSLIGQITKLEVASPFAPARAMILQERKPVDPVIFVRGDRNARGEKVPRRFLKILRKEGEVFEKGSGRLELAHRLTDDRNPLTARVWANRVWMHAMGAPLVESPGDFGFETARPVQLELLDHLAVFLIEKKWSTKALISHIMTSEAWRRESRAPAELIETDPENQFYARANRVRKDLEAWRDSALQVSGRLDSRLGGQPVKLDEAPFVPRRTIYGQVRRGYLSSVMRAFDFPGSEEASMKRSETTTPMQALYLMNSPFLQGEAQGVVKGLGSDSDLSAATVQKIYQQVLQRPASLAEAGAAVAWLAKAKPQRTAGPWDYGYLLDGSLDFKTLPLFKDGRWCGGEVVPDAKLGYLQWTHDAGHPELDKAVALAWTASESGVLRLRGTLEAVRDQGNGVRARVMRPSGEVLGEWKAGPTEKVPTLLRKVEVKAGEQLWFVVDSRGDQGFDSFRWAPRLFDEVGKVADASEEFVGPGLRPLAQLAQVLLLSNEFFYID
ncbi:MAG: DUF1549 and DUF1553 domain-containing protein [Akkermansiaceae bacterium]